MKKGKKNLDSFKGFPSNWDSETLAFCNDINVNSLCKIRNNANDNTNNESYNNDDNCNNNI